MLKIGFLIAVLFAVSAPARAHEMKDQHDHHQHDAAFSAGEPGNPQKPARVVQVWMTESDGKMLFRPSRIEVVKDEQIRFILRNSGQIEHEFVLASTEDNLKHAEAMKADPDMKHDDPNSRHVSPSRSGDILWKFTKAGEFEYACLIPGHREAGMIGTISVK